MCTPIALQFMSESRQNAFDSGANTGYSWRDSHQFSFEVDLLVKMYIASPKYFNSLEYDIYKVAECEYSELQTQAEPDIIWLL